MARGFGAAAMAWCASALVCVPVAGQSLADVARLEAERRKTIARPSRVYTNHDLKPAPEPPALSETGGMTAPDTQPPSATHARGKGAGGEATRQLRGNTSRTADAHAEAASEADARADEHSQDEVERDATDERASEKGRPRDDDEQRWRQRAAEARDRVDRSHIFADALQSRINALAVDFASRDDPAQRAGIGDELNKTLAELERVRREIGEYEKGMADLEEEARRAGVPPGWLR
jgi:hypothetical protein